MSGESSALIELGVVGAPFGVRGWVKLRSYTEPPERLLEHRSLQLRLGGAWRAYRVEASGRSGGQLTVKLVGVEDRDAAQALTGAPIGVPRSELPARGAKDFYRADLIGCEVVNLDGCAAGGRAAFCRDSGARADGGARGARILGAGGAAAPAAGGFAGAAGRRGLGRGAAVLSAHAYCGRDSVSADAARGAGARRAGAGARARGVRGRVLRPARLHHRPAPHGGRPALRRGPRHGAEGGAVARRVAAPPGRRCRRAAGECIWARTGSGSSRAWRARRAIGRV